MKPTFSIRLTAQAQDAVQRALFAIAAPEPEPEPECDHVDTGRAEQVTLFGTTETVCARCWRVLDERGPSCVS